MRNLFRRVLLSSLLAAAFAGATGIAIAGPCDADIEKVCGDVRAGRGQIADCLNRQSSELSYECRDWLKRMETPLRRIGNACSDAAINFCTDVRPGYGRVMACLRNNFDKLPQECQQALNAH